jgi:tetraacyldisaccharide 4'-kinase
MSASRRLTQAWTERGPLAWLLWPLSLVYGVAVAVRRWLFESGHRKTSRVPVPVIVVGNVVAGGAGKTPVVMTLVRRMQRCGLQVGVVSRGYGRLARDCREVLPDSLVQDVGDEPALIQRACNAPVFVAPRRLDAAQALLAKYPLTQVIVCDDGLQHHALHRDLEICVFDDRGIGNGFLLPAGPLREPWPRGSRWRGPYPPATTLLLHTGQRRAFPDGFIAKRALADHALRVDGRAVPLAELRAKPVAAVAAIARPEQFFSMLRDQGLTLARTEALPDHYDYDSWSRIFHEGYSLICTEKDAVKLWRTRPDALAVPLELVPEPGFLAAFDAVLSAWGLTAASADS